MSRTRKAAVTAAFSYGRFAMAIVPGILLVPLTLACLGARTYGLWLTVGELLAYAAMVDPGIVGVLPWMIAQADGSSDRHALRRLVSNGLVAGCVAGVGYVLVAAAVWTVLPSALAWTAADRALLGPPLALLVVVTGVTYPFRIFRGVLMGLQDVVVVGAIAIAEIAIGVALLAALLLGGYNVWALVIAAAVSSTFMAAACAVRVAILAPDLLTDWERPSGAGLWLLLHNGFGAWLAGFGWQVVSASNNIVIASLGHPEWVPIFACTAKTSVVLLQLGWVMPDSGLVGLAQLHGERPRSDRLKQMVGALVQLHLLIAGAAACGVLAFNPEFVARWVGAPFFGGLRLNALLAGGLLTYALIHSLVSAASVVGNRLQVGSITIVNGIVQLGFALLFGRRWGLNGVAAAGLLAGGLTAIPCGLVLLQAAGVVRVRALIADVVLAWAWRATPLIAVAAAVGVFHRALGPWLTGFATVVIALGYIWHMRPLYRRLPLDPRWVRWLVSLRLIPRVTVAPVEQE